MAGERTIQIRVEVRMWCNFQVIVGSTFFNNMDKTELNMNFVGDAFSLAFYFILATITPSKPVSLLFLL